VASHLRVDPPAAPRGVLRRRHLAARSFDGRFGKSSVVYVADWPVLKHAKSTVFAVPDCASRSKPLSRRSGERQPKVTHLMLVCSEEAGTAREGERPLRRDGSVASTLE